jgi:hypothetical protein
MARRKKSKSRSKAKRRKFIAKISRDRKITKKEGKKAAKKGISLRKIQNRNISDYRSRKESFSKNMRVRARNPGAKRPQYEPLKIKRGAYQADSRRQEPTRRPAPTRRGPSRSSSPTQPDPVVTSQPIGDFTPIQPEQTQFEMPDFEGMMAEQAASYQDELASMREAQRAAEEEYRRQALEQQRKFELAQRTMLGNEARAGQQASYQFGGAPGSKRGGTFGFRRRPRSVMGGIAPTLAAATGGMLNV